jgi:hypothetical protein
MSAATAMPLVTFNNDDCARMFNSNMNYALPTDGPRIFNVNGQRYVKNGTEKMYGAGHSLTIWQKYALARSETAGDGSAPQSEPFKEFYFRQPAGLFTSELEFMMPYKEDETLKFGYNVGRGHYAGTFECSSAEHEVKISDSGNVVVAEKATGQVVWVIYW